MIKWKILAVAGLTFGVIGMGLAVTAQRSDPQVFELRIYKAMPGKRDVLATRFRDHTMAMFEKAGMRNVGYWTAVTGDEVDRTFIYMLAYPSQEARADMWKTLGADPDFQREVIAMERSEERKLVDTIDARLLVPTEFSPLR